MHVLITGGAGFIGSHLAEYHLKQGDRVYAVDNLSTGSRGNIEPFLTDPHFRFDEVDIVTWNMLDLLGVRPRTRRHWMYLAITIAFLFWILAGMISLRSR